MKLRAGRFVVATWRFLAAYCIAAIVVACGGAERCAGQSKWQTQEFARQINSWLTQNGQRQASRPRQVVVIAQRRFEALNLQFNMPGRPWVELKQQTDNPIVLLTLGRAKPEIYAMLIGERLGVESNVSLQAAVEISKANLKSQALEVDFHGESNEAANGIAGITYKATVKTAESQLYWVSWVGVKNGYVYQLQVWGAPGAATHITNAARMLRSRLRPIDPGLVARAAAGTVVQRVRSSAFGYELDLTGKGWTKWVSMRSDFPGGEFGGENRLARAAMLVLPVPMPDREPDFESLTKAMLARLSLTYPGDNIIAAGECEVGLLRGRRFRAVRVMNGTTAHCDMRVVADKRAAYLVCGWVIGEAAAHQAVLEEALDSVRITTRDLPQNPELRELQKRVIALILNDIGMAEYGRGDYVAAVDFLESAGSYFRENEMIVANHVGVLAELDRTTEALLILEQREAFGASSVPLKALKAKILGKRSDNEAARKVYAELIAGGCTEHEIIIPYLALAMETEAFDEAIATMEAVAVRQPTVDVKRCCAGLYFRKGDFDKAIAMLQSLRSQHPENGGVAFDLAGVYAKAGRHAEAVEITQKLIDEGEQAEELLILHGQILLQREEWSKAKETFEKAESLYPQSDEAAEGLKTASMLLGEGDNSALKTPIEPVEVPAVVAAAIAGAAAGPALDAEKHGAEELSRVDGIYFKQGEPLRKTTTRRIKLHTAGGVSRFSTLTFGFNAARERIYVNRLVVLDGEGNEVTEGSPTNYFVVDDASSGVASSKKLVKAPVPGLKPGYTLECTVTREDKFPAVSFPFQEVIFSSSVPIATAAFFVRGDVAGLKFATSLPMTVEVAGDTLYCVEANPAPYEYEASQPSTDSFLPMVWVGPSDATWESEAREYLDMIGDRLAQDDETRAFARELTQECTTKRDKLAAIVGHLQRAYTYQAIEFGRRSNVPNSATRTLHLKYGDCKDHAVLVKLLLEAVGIESHLALVKSAGRVVEELPSLDQFDHMIVFVPAAAIGEPGLDEPGLDEPGGAMGGLLIDATEKDADPFLIPPYGLADRAVFVLAPNEPRMIHTPSYPSQGGQMSMEREIALRLDESTGSFDAHVQETVTFNAYLAPAMRAYLRNFEAGRQREALQDLLADYGQLRITSVEVKNLEALTEPLCLALEYVAPDVFHSIAALDEASLVGRLPCPWERNFLQAAYADKRETPFEISVPMVVRSSLKINLPAGYQPAGLERTSGSGQSEFTAWQCRARHDESTVAIDYEFRLMSGRYPAEAYDRYYSAMKQSLSALQATITLREDKLQTANRPEAEHSSR